MSWEEWGTTPVYSFSRSFHHPLEKALKHNSTRLNSFFFFQLKCTSTIASSFLSSDKNQSPRILRILEMEQDRHSLKKWPWGGVRIGSWGNAAGEKGEIWTFPASTFPYWISLVIVCKFGYRSYKYKKVNSVTPLSWESSKFCVITGRETDNTRLRVRNVCLPFLLSLVTICWEGKKTLLFIWTRGNL